MPSDLDDVTEMVNTGYFAVLAVKLNSGWIWIGDPVFGDHQFLEAIFRKKLVLLLNLDVTIWSTSIVGWPFVISHVIIISAIIFTHCRP